MNDKQYNMNQHETGALRESDDAKPRYDLIPPDVLELVAWHFTHSLKKYPENNWKKGLPLSSHIQSLLRHTNQAHKLYDRYGHANDGIEVEDRYRQRQEQKNPYRFRDTVNRVAVHSLEDLSALFNRIDDDRKPGCQQHDIRRRTGSVCRSRDSYPCVRLFEWRSIVNAVASHSDDVSCLL